MTTFLFIGDRQVGKTASIVALTDPNQMRLVQVPNANHNFLKTKHAPGIPTKEVGDIDLQVEVDFGMAAGGSRTLMVTSRDTPGEMWREAVTGMIATQKQDVISAARHSEGILLILPPYRELIESCPQAARVNLDDFPTKKQWCTRFDRWVNFLNQECPRARHIAICLNKADLFCEPNYLARMAKELAFDPDRNQVGWHDRHLFVLQHYFHPVKDSIAEINRRRVGVVVRCFLTSIENRDLLELPWIYLASYLG
jgi:hypothetical protein